MTRNERMDWLYDLVDSWFYAGRFDDANFVLECVRTDGTDIDCLVGWLTATLPAKSKLPSRAEFFRRVEAELRTRPEWEEGLLRGLE